MNLFDMKPGREMDKRLAVELFGWKKKKSMYLTPNQGYKYVPPAYSTTWEGMGMVVEELRTKVQWIGIETFGEKVRCCIIVKKSNDRKDDKWHEAVSEFAPHAVCLAALLAKEGGRT